MSIRTQVEETIEVIRPALQADGGDIILREVDEVTGVVSVRFVTRFRQTSRQATSTIRGLLRARGPTWFVRPSE